MFELIYQAFYPNDHLSEQKTIEILQICLDRLHADCFQKYQQKI
jgi:hypothetical protein